MDDEKSIICLNFFPGFYDSHLSALLDSEEEQFAESQVEWINDPTSKEVDALRYTVDYGAANEALSKEWLASVNRQVRSELDYAFDAEFESVISPKFYNFMTDQLFVHVSTIKLAGMLVALSTNKAGFVVLTELIKDRFTSRDGFISYYSNDVARWLDKPLADWDHNELGTLVEVFLRWNCNLAGLDWPMLVNAFTFELDTGNGEIMSCFDAGLDNDAYEKRLADEIENDVERKKS